MNQDVWLRVDKLLNIMPKVTKLVELRCPLTRKASREMAEHMLIDTMNNVCEAYNITPPKLTDPTDILMWAIEHGETQRAYSALAFGHLARAAMYCVQLPEEFAGFPCAQAHMYYAAQWAARQFADCYVLQTAKIVAESPKEMQNN